MGRGDGRVMAGGTGGIIYVVSGGMRPQILICGAGPTGLILAIWLAKREISFRIIDKAPKGGTASRALVIHARTMEFYRQLGLDEIVSKRSLHVERMRLWVRQRAVATVNFGAGSSGGQSGAGSSAGKLGGASPAGKSGGGQSEVTAYPAVLVFPQDEHEAVLEQALADMGIHVERNTELLSFKECPGCVMARLKKADGEEETAEFAWLAGCDGARSTGREHLGVGFPGGTYEHTFYVADITGEGPVINSDFNIALDDADFLAIFPLKEQGRARLIGTVQEKTNGLNGVMEDRVLQWSDVSQDILRRANVQVQSVNWFSTYRVHHRVASAFRKGRVFILGDAAHVHSPLGGQGMNTGIGDAVNLGWKLEAVLTRGAPAAILDSYEQERIGFARRLVATTDRAFTFVNKDSALAASIRTRIVPVVMPLLFRSAAVRRFVFRNVSQTKIEYRRSVLSLGKMGPVHSGDRLPWLSQQDNYAPLLSLDWQIHIFGSAPQKLIAYCMRWDLVLHSFRPEGPFHDGTLCLVRPDGYIGWIGHDTDLAGLARYVRRWCVA